MNVDKFSGLPIGTHTFVTLGTAWEAIELAQENLLRQNSELTAAVSALEANRKRTQAALHESEERFRFLVEGVKEYAIFRLSPDGTGVKRTGGIICWRWCQSIFVKALPCEGIIAHH